MDNYFAYWDNDFRFYNSKYTKLSNDFDTKFIDKINFSNLFSENDLNELAEINKSKPSLTLNIQLGTKDDVDIIYVKLIGRYYFYESFMTFNSNLDFRYSEVIDELENAIGFEFDDDFLNGASEEYNIEEMDKCVPSGIFFHMYNDREYIFDFYCYDINGNEYHVYK